MNESSYELGFSSSRRALKKRERAMLHELPKCLSLLLVEAYGVSVIIFSVISSEIIISDIDVVTLRRQGARWIEISDQIADYTLSIQ